MHRIHVYNSILRSGFSVFFLALSFIPFFMGDVVVVDIFYLFFLQFGAHLFARDERKALTGNVHDGVYWKVNWMLVAGVEGNRLHGHSTVSHVRSQYVLSSDALNFRFSVIIIGVSCHFSFLFSSFSFHRSRLAFHTQYVPLVSRWRWLLVTANDEFR